MVNGGSWQWQVVIVVINSDGWWCFVVAGGVIG